MAWTKQQLAGAFAVAALSLMSGGAAGFIIGSRHQMHSASKAGQPPVVHKESTDLVSETDSDPDETSSAAVPANGRHAGTRFLAAKKDSTETEAQKKEAPLAVNTATNANTNATVAAAETGTGTSRRRGSRRAP